MTEDEQLKVVFDCNLFAQALISSRGPAGACFSHVQRGVLQLFVSEFVYQELRELPLKIRPKYGVDDTRIERLIRELEKYASFIEHVPSVYIHPLDPDDSHYVDLAVATGAKLIVSRDRDLQALMDEKQSVAREFKHRFPTIEILNPESLLNRLRVPD